MLLGLTQEEVERLLHELRLWRAVAGYDLNRNILNPTTNQERIDFYERLIARLASGEGAYERHDQGR